MPVYLIRHAHAGSRSRWDGDDDTRPLSAKGRGQAERLADRLGTNQIERVVSSPSLRCIETAEPLAERRGIEVESDRAFEEGADTDEAFEHLLDLAAHDVVVCSHGDVIPKLIRRLAREGMRTKDPNLSQKGSAWILEVEDDRFTRGRYVPPS